MNLSKFWIKNVTKIFLHKNMFIQSAFSPLQRGDGHWKAKKERKKIFKLHAK